MNASNVKHLPPRLNFRRATDDDVLLVQELVCNVLLEFGISPDLEYRDEDLREIELSYPPPGALFLVAEDAKGDLFGTASIKPFQPGVAEMGRLYVAPPYRRQGLGTQLVNQMIRFAQEQGYEQLWLETYSSMTAAIQLYEKLGFEPIAPYSGRYLEFGDRAFCLRLQPQSSPSVTANQR